MNEVMRRDAIRLFRVRSFVVSEMARLGYADMLGPWSNRLEDHKEWKLVRDEAARLGPLDPSEPEVLERVEGERPGVWFAVPGCDARVFAPTEEGVSGAELLSVFKLSSPFDDLSLEQTLRVVYDMGRVRGRADKNVVRERTIRECAEWLQDWDADRAKMDVGVGDALLEAMGLEP